MSLSLQKNIFIGFFRSGMLGFGGGPSTIPLVHKEVVETYGWMSEDEFGDVLAIGNTLPGPIMTKMAGYIGYRVGGLVGMATALAAAVLPTVLIMITLIGVLVAYRDTAVVQGMTQAIAPVVGVMLFVLAYSFIKKSKADLGWLWAGVLAVVSLVTYVWLNWHPAILIGALILFALLGKRRESS
ncbi:chromate transporter [Filobacillus milosensis]|uniref:Chromate transporter n=1 Tax=Filobacillus milosensis TaxID=94137 RepID=A0A4Y8IRR8_9BACI|nr:chromate transporter [Filobacillus milosensis]TFB24473.1 chromate transporter [Filobacillus milosensis]